MIEYEVCWALADKTLAAHLLQSIRHVEKESKIVQLTYAKFSDADVFFAVSGLLAQDSRTEAHICYALGALGYRVVIPADS
jgi:hypothetical protein